MKNITSLTDVKTLRARARQHLAEGAVTAGYGADREVVLKLLNDALATEIVCALRYRRHHFMAKGIQSKSIAIDSYRDIVQYIGDRDPTTRRMLEGILAVEGRHADELADLLEGLPEAARTKAPAAVLLRSE